MTTGGDSIVFDWAAEIYDSTRTLSPEPFGRVIEMLAGELRGRGEVLEVGVGTGRIAVPLLDRGIPISGVDLSRKMIDKLLEKKPDFSVEVADATRLPFADGSFGAGIACHVLHLITRWREAVGELVRVTRPGGVILVDRGGRAGLMREIEERFALESGRSGPAVGLDDIGELDEEMSRLGAEVRLLPTVREKGEWAPGALIAAFEAGIFSAAWVLDAATRRQAADATREWAKGRFGDLDRPLNASFEITWHAYDLP